MTAAATIQDVADRAGVSRAAVSKVIRNAYGVSASMKEKVGAAIEELDYRPSVAARAMRGSSFTIGIELPNMNNPFFNKVIAGATEALAGTDYQLIVAPASNDNEEGFRAIRALADRSVDGLIAISPLVQQEWLERMAVRMPIVMLGRHDVTGGYDSVTGDDALGTGMVMDHLFELGHRSIAHVTVRALVTDNADGNPHGVRLAEYSRLMRGAGLESHIRVVRTGLDVERDIYGEVVELMRSEHRPTAIFAGNDLLAMPVLRAIADEGLTAADVSVIGYDDTDIAGQPGVSLSTVDQSGVQMGERSIALLLDRIAGRTESIHHMFEPTLVVRASTAPAPSIH